MSIKNTLGEPAFRQVARAIEARILAREIAPDEQLPTEVTLAARLGVNRSTVREAIRVLEQSGFVRREPGRKKLYASMPRSRDIAQRLTVAMVMNQVTFEELWEAMYALEPAAAAGAAKRCTDEDILAIEANLAATRQALADSLSLTDLDIEFHDLVARATRNRAIQMSRQPLGDLFYPPFHAVMSRLNAGQRLLFAHENIATAIRAHDEKQAREWMEKHILDFQRGYELANLDMGGQVGMPTR
ncbi:MAG: FCD domain-containing protein [Micavibrio sp.]|nr:FCD domain-containing protein [Micavibrio sp.]